MKNFFKFKIKCLNLDSHLRGNDIRKGFTQHYFFSKKNSAGFILPFSILLTYIILLISVGVSDILVKEVYFSQLGRESQLSYYAADAGLDCALYIDSLFIDQASGVGIFPYNDVDGDWEGDIIAQSPYTDTGGVDGPFDLTQANYSDNIKCAGSKIFALDSSASNYTKRPTDIILNDETKGVTTTFTLHMDRQNGIITDQEKEPCAEVTIEKSLTSGNHLTRRIISRGYNICDKNNPRLVERAIINNKY